MTTLSTRTETTNHERRNSIIVCLIGAIAFGITLPTTIEPFTRSNSWQVYANLLSSVVPTLAWLWGLWFVRRNRAATGIQIGLISSLIAIPPSTYWTEGIALANAIVVAVGTVIIAGVCLRASLARWYIFVGMLSAVLCLALDVLAPSPRLISAQDAWLINLSIAAALLALTVFVFFQFPRYSLRTKLIISFVTLAVLSIAGLTYVTAETIRETLTARQANDLRTRAQAAALAIGITMDRNVDRIQTLSLDRNVRDALTLLDNSYPTDAPARNATIARNTERWASADPQDNIIRSALNGPMAFSLRGFGNVYRGNRELFITDAYGAVVAATDWRPHYTHAHENWWQIAYNNGRGSVYIGQPEFNPMISEYGVRIAMPIFSTTSQRAIGVLHSVFTLTALQRALLLNSFGQSGKIDLLFPLGQVLTSEGTFRALRPEEFDEIKSGINQPLAGLNYRGSPLLSGQGVVGVSDEQPEPYLRSSAWRTIATIQEEEALGIVEAAVEGALLVGAGAIAIAIVAALFLSQLLSRPIRRLTSVAAEIQGGDLSARAPVETGDELGTLAQTFNSMAARLQETLSGLEQRVTERTRELYDANLTLQANSAYLSALSDTSTGLFERLNLNELLQTIVERAGALVGTQNGFVFYAQPGENEIQMRVGSGLYDDLVGTRAQKGVGLAGSVWQSGEPMTIEDYQKWEGRLPGSRRDALRAIVAVPLKRGGGAGHADDETVGVIGLAYTEEGRYFGKTEVEILQRFAQLASIALDNAELYANSENRVQELAALNSIGQLIVQAGDSESGIARVGDEIRRIFDADFGYLALYNSETRKIEFPYAVDEGNRIQLDPILMGEGITSQIISSGQTILLSHATAEDYERLGAVDSGDDTSPHSLLAVPVRTGDKIIGALSVQRVALDRPFAPEDANLLTTIATNIGVGIENIRLAQATQRRVQELSALNQVGAILNTAQDFQERLRQVGFAVAQTFQVSSLYIALYDAARDMIEMPFFIEEGVQEEIPPRPRGTGLVAHMIATRETLLINNNMQRRFEELGGVWIGNTDLQTQGYLGVPLVAGDQVLGVIALNALEENRFTDSDVKFLQTIAGVISTAIQNEYLAQATQQRLAELGALNRISAMLTTDQPLEERLGEVGRELHRIFDVLSVYVALYDETTNIVRMPFFRGDNQEFVIEPFEPGPGFTSHIIKTRQPLLINDNIEEMMRSLQALNAGKSDVTQSYLGVPVMLGDRVLGVVGLSAEPKNKFQDSDVRLLNTIAAAIASAIQNARLLEQTLERARELDAVNSLAREITQQRSLDDLFQEVYLQVKSVSQADGLLISLYDDRTNTFSVPFLIDEGVRYEIAPDALELERQYADQVRLGDPVVVNSTPEQVAEFEKSMAVSGTGRAARSRLYVPLMAGVRFLGMLSLHSYNYDAYSQRDISVLTGLASHIAIALENARLFEQTQAALAESKYLYRIAEAANTQVDEQAFYKRVHEIVGEAMPAKNFLVALYNAEDTTMDMVYFEDEQDTLPEMPLRRINVGTGITAYVLRTRKPLLATKEEIRRLAAKGELQLHGGESETWLGVPMMRGDQPLGVIAVQTYDPAVRYTEHDKQILINLSQGIANAMERKRAEVELQNALAETQRLADRARAAADQVTALNRRLTREGWREYLDQLNSRLVVEAAGDEGNGRAATSTDRSGGSSNGANGQDKIRVPIQLRGEVIGEIELEPDEAAHPMSDEDLGLVTHVAENIGLALDNARLFTETQRRVTELDALNSITQAVTTELDLESLLSVIGDELQSIFDVQNTYIALYDHETQVISLPYFVTDRQRVSVDPIPYGEGITSHIIRTRQPLVINRNTDQAMAELGAKTLGNPARSYLGVPIFVGDEVTGVISIQSTIREDVFDESNVRLMETIAATVGAAIQNAQLWGAMQQEVLTRQRAEEEIKLSLKEKEVLLKEIHHRVKNNLQIITSLLNLQSAQIKDPDAIMLFRESQSRVRSMALIHEKLYQSKDLARIDFDGYVRDLMVYLFRSYAANPEQIRTHIETHGMFLGIDTAIPCGLIISELVTNTIKYAFPQGKRGNLYVGLGPEDDGHLTLLVKDDGVGFPDNFDWRESDSLGLQLVSTLSSQLHGTILVNGSGGTSFKITFPG